MQVSVEDMLSQEPNNKQNTTTYPKTNYFSLKQDGESAIVRFLHTNIKDFDVLDVHEITVNGYTRKANCIKSKDGEKDECPLCKFNAFMEDKRKYTFPLRRKIYIHMIKYDNPTTPVEVVWERSADFIGKLNQFEQDYGDLCDTLFRIVRRGAQGSMQTTYDIIPLGKDRFNPANYTFNRDMLNYRKALGTVVFDKNYEELYDYAMTGQFPVKNNQQGEVKPRPQMNLNAQFDDEAPAPTPAPTYSQAPERTYQAPTQDDMPWSQRAYTGDIPRRGRI